jgi:hypothetical protein
MPGHEVWQEILSLFFALLQGFELCTEPVKNFPVRFVHGLRDFPGNMLRGNFKMPGNMVITDHPQVTGIIGKGQIVPDAGTDEDMSDTGNSANPGKQPALFFVTGVKVFTGWAAAFIRTCTAAFPQVAGEVIHIRCRTPDILDNAVEGRHLCHAGYFTDD